MRSLSSKEITVANRRNFSASLREPLERIFPIGLKIHGLSAVGLFVRSTYFSSGGTKSLSP